MHNWELTGKKNQQRHSAKKKRKEKERKKKEKQWVKRHRKKNVNTFPALSFLGKTEAISRYFHRTFAVEAILKINKQTALDSFFFYMKNVRFMESGVFFFWTRFLFRHWTLWCVPLITKQMVLTACLRGLAEFGKEDERERERDEVGYGWSCQQHSTRQVVGLALLSGITDVRFLLAGHK